jgi:hypothetical protein
LAALGGDAAAFARLGATIAAISVDPPGANAAMVDKLRLPFPLLSDPDGSGAIIPSGLWNASQSIAKPAILVIAPDGREVYRYTGQNFMDRPNDSDVLAALEQFRLALLPEAAAPVPHLEPAPGRRAYTLENLTLYLRAVGNAMRALVGRLADPAAREDAERTAQMAERYVKAVAAVRQARSAPA